MDIHISKEEIDKITQKLIKESNFYQKMLKEGIKDLSLIDIKQRVDFDEYAVSKIGKRINKILDKLYIIQNYSKNEMVYTLYDFFEEYITYFKFNNQFYSFHSLYGQGVAMWVEKCKSKPNKKFYELKELE